MLYCYLQGLLTEARIRNDLSILREAMAGMRELLGVKAPVVAESAMATA